MVASKVVLIAAADRQERGWLAGLVAADSRMEPREVADAASATARLLARAPRIDALVIDGALDGDAAEALCASLRRRGVGQPILVIGPDDEAIAVRSLDAGANDYLARPLRPAEFAARVRAQLRLYEGSDNAVLAIGPYQFHPGRRLLVAPDDGRRILLTEKEAAVLKFLYRAGGAPVPRKLLLHHVWGYSPNVASHTVETHIYRLRRKIEPEGGEGRLLANDGHGYRLRLDAPALACRAMASLPARPAIPSLRA